MIDAGLHYEEKLAKEIPTTLEFIFEKKKGIPILEIISESLLCFILTKPFQVNCRIFSENIITNGNQLCPI